MQRAMDPNIYITSAYLITALLLVGLCVQTWRAARRITRQRRDHPHP